MKPLETFLLLQVVLVLAAGAPETSDSLTYGVLDDGTSGLKELIKSSNDTGNDSGTDDCDTGEYADNNGSCHKCFGHNYYCTKSRQCCSVPHMACWRYGFGNPFQCKCNPDYSWDQEKGECYYNPTPGFFLVMAYTALFAAAVIGICAILVHIIAHLRRRCCRTSRYEGSNPFNRQAIRHDPRYLNTTSAGPLPAKPPTYDDVYFGISTRQASIRSMPPAYAPSVPDTAATTQPKQVEDHGVCNPAFASGQHI